MVRHIGWMAVCAGVFAMSASTAQAQHFGNWDELECATDRLHQAMRHFEAVACRRRLPTCDRNFIQLTVRQSCRLAESARCGSYGRVLSDFSVLRIYMESVDRRLRLNCELRGDHELWNCWDHVLHQFEDVQCLISRPSISHPRSRRIDYDPHYGNLRGLHYDPRFGNDGGACLSMPGIGLQLHFR